MLIFLEPQQSTLPLDASGCIGGPSIRTLLLGVFVRLIESSGQGYFFVVALFVPHETIDEYLLNTQTHTQAPRHPGTQSPSHPHKRSLINPHTHVSGGTWRKWKKRWMSNDKESPRANWSKGIKKQKYIQGWRIFIQGWEFESPKYRVWINTVPLPLPLEKSKEKAYPFCSPDTDCRPSPLIFLAQHQTFFGCNIGKFDKPEDWVRAAHWQMERATNLSNYFLRSEEGKSEEGLRTED